MHHVAMMILLAVPVQAYTPGDSASSADEGIETWEAQDKRMAKEERDGNMPQKIKKIDRTWQERQNDKIEKFRKLREKNLNLARTRHKESNQLTQTASEKKQKLKQYIAELQAKDAVVNGPKREEMHRGLAELQKQYGDVVGARTGTSKKRRTEENRFAEASSGAVAADTTATAAATAAAAAATKKADTSAAAEGKRKKKKRKVEVQISDSTNQMQAVEVATADIQGSETDAAEEKRKKKKIKVEAENKRLRVQISYLEEQVGKQEKQLNISRTWRNQEKWKMEISLLKQQVADLKDLQEEASRLKQQHRLKIADLEQQVMKQQEQLNITERSHKRVAHLRKQLKKKKQQLADVEASQQQGSSLEQQQRLRIADLEQQVAEQAGELSITKISHEQLWTHKKQLGELEASLHQASSLEQQQRLRIADFEQQLEKQAEELNITKSSHEQLSMHKKQLAELEASLDQASSLEQQQRLKIGDLEQQVAKQAEELSMNNDTSKSSDEQLSMHNNFNSLLKQLRELEDSLQQASSLEQQQRLRIADFEQQLEKQAEELNITKSSHEQLSMHKKQLAEMEASLDRASSLEQQQRLKIADLEQHVAKQAEELSIAKSSHEQLSIHKEQLAELEASQQRASSLENQQRLRIGDLEQQVANQAEELSITKGSHEQLSMHKKQLAELEASLKQGSSLEQQQRLRIADLEQQVTEQEGELNVTRSSHNQVPALTRQLDDLKAFQQQASSVDQQHRLRITDLEQQVSKHLEELDSAQTSHEQVLLLTKQIAELEASQQQASSLEQQQRLRIADLDLQAAKQGLRIADLEQQVGEQQVAQKGDESIATRNSTEQAKLLMEQLVELERRITDLNLQIAKQEEELNMTRISHEQVPVLLQQLADKETLQQHASSLELRIAYLEKQITKSDEDLNIRGDELSSISSSHEQVSLRKRRPSYADVSRLAQQVAKQEEVLVSKELNITLNSDEQASFLNSTGNAYGRFQGTDSVSITNDGSGPPGFQGTDSVSISNDGSGPPGKAKGKAKGKGKGKVKEKAKGTRPGSPTPPPPRPGSVVAGLKLPGSPTRRSSQTAELFTDGFPNIFDIPGMMLIGLSMGSGVKFAVFLLRAHQPLGEEPLLNAYT